MIEFHLLRLMMMLLTNTVMGYYRVSLLVPTLSPVYRVVRGDDATIDTTLLCDYP